MTEVRLIVTMEYYRVGHLLFLLVTAECICKIK